MSKYILYVSVLGDNLRYPNYGYWVYCIYTSGGDFIGIEEGGCVHIYSDRDLWLEAINRGLNDVRIKEDSRVRVITNTGMPYMVYTTYMNGGEVGGMDRQMEYRLRGYSDTLVLKGLSVEFSSLREEINSKIYKRLLALCFDGFYKVSGIAFDVMARKRRSEEFKNSIRLYDYKKRNLYNILNEVMEDIKDGVVDVEDRESVAMYIDKVVDDRFISLLDDPQKLRLKGLYARNGMELEIEDIEKVKKMTMRRLRRKNRGRKKNK